MKRGVLHAVVVGRGFNRGKKNNLRLRGFSP